MELTKRQWLASDRTEFLNYLNTFSKGKEKGEWERRIVNTNLPCIAVPSTEVDRIAREIFRGNYKSFLDLWIWENHTTTLIFGKILSKIKDFDEQKSTLSPTLKKPTTGQLLTPLGLSLTTKIPKNIWLYQKN